MSVSFKAIIDVMENLAPLTLKEDWDNPGLLVGNPEQEVQSVLLTLDVTKENVCYAVDHGFDCIISHHPVIFSGIKALRTDTYDGRMFAQLLSHNIGVYCSHTNLDSATGGVNDVLASLLELHDVRPLDGEEGSSMGRIGRLSETMSLAEVMEYIKVKLNRTVLPYGGKEKEIVESIALCGGAATCFMNDAVRAGADLYLTGDVKYHDFQQAVKDDIFLVDGGHYGTEFPVVFELQRLLQTESEKRGWEVKFVVDSTSRDFISYL